MKITNLIIGLGLLALGSATSIHAQESDTTAVHSPSPYSLALKDTDRGLTTTAENYLGNLSKKEAKQFDNLLLSARVLVHQLHIDKAKSELAALSKIKLKSEDTRQELAQVQKQVEEVERLMGNTFIVPVIGNHTGEEAMISNELRRHTAHLGTNDATSYTTSDGSTRWEVLNATGKQPALSISYLLGDGNWDKEGTKIVEINGINPEGHVAYPFLMQDGQTLYFAYSGPETMGGYDLYVTRYDSSAGTLLVPQQLPIPFNSTADDLTYIIDDESKVGYLLTTRGTTDGEARLIILKSDEQKRVENIDPETTRRIALMDSVITADMPQRLLHPANRESSLSHALLSIGNRPIHEENDLSSPDARATFRRMSALIEQRNRLDNDLASMRNAIREGRQSSISRSTVLEMEEKRWATEREIKALRNEIIRQEQKRN